MVLAYESFSQQGCGFQTLLLTLVAEHLHLLVMGFLLGRVQNHRTSFLSPADCLSSPVWPNSRFIPAFTSMCILMLTLGGLASQQLEILPLSRGLSPGVWV